VKRKYRLTRSTEFERVRRTGKSYAHPLVVLIVQSNSQEITRVGVSAGRSVGGAVERNRAKRLLREALHPLLPDLPPGYNLILIARRPMQQADLPQTETALLQLFQRSRLLNSTDDPKYTA
jgi:ribonuclease P protein component